MKIRVHYPLVRGELALRTDRDWDRDVAPSAVDAGRQTFEFGLGNDAPFRYFKPVLRDGDGVRWAQGDNFLLAGEADLEVFPHFAAGERCRPCDPEVVPSRFQELGHEVRVFLPRGYDENTLSRHPVVYMQDGRNLFRADEAFGGRHWRVPETLADLEAMDLIQRVIVVGIHPTDRMRDYTAPGYDDYGRFVVHELKPWVDARYRTRPEPAATAVMGSSLGGVVSLHLAWNWPEVFGMAACMSSSFGYRDDLRQQVLGGGRRDLRIYLDSGWPGDNYEVTRGMHAALRACGYRDGVDLQYLAFPLAGHDEAAWAARAHLPLQFFFRV